MSNKAIEHPHISGLKVFIASGLFFLSGLTSSYLYYKYHNSGGVFFPGILYTSSTVIVFVICNISLKIKDLAIYYLLMNLTYLVIWLLTMFSSWFAVVGGVITAGAGAIITFLLVNKYIQPFKFKRFKIFVAGGTAFLLVDILMAAFEKTPIEFIFKIEGSIGTLFGDVFIFWHSIVGIVLILTLANAQRSQV